MKRAAVPRCAYLPPPGDLPKHEDGKNSVRELRAFAHSVPHDQLMPGIFAGIDLIARNWGKGEAAAQIRRWFVVKEMIEVLLRDVARLPRDPNYRL